jgi:hypothetical protein
MLRAGSAAALLLAVSACSGSKPMSSDHPVDVQRAEVQGSSTPSQSARGPVVVQLQLRDHVLVVRAGSGSGALSYDVENRSGTLLADALSWRELEQQFPTIADKVRDSTALTIDASLTGAGTAERAASPR